MTLRYWASARASAGVEYDVIDVPEGVALRKLVEESVRRHGGSRRFAEVLESCSVLLDDRPLGATDRDTVRVEPGTTVEFLPPFAGG